MSYITQRHGRFYVVVYDGVDRFNGKERRRWIPAGTSRADAVEIAESFDRERDARRDSDATTVMTFGTFMTDEWLPRKERTVSRTTGARYRWIVEHYIVAHLGTTPLRKLRPDDLDRLYSRLRANGGRYGRPLADKTVLEVHVLIRSCLADAHTRRLIPTNPALAATRPRIPAGRVVPQRWWNATEVHQFLTAARKTRLYPALHLAAMTGMRRGELLGLRWGDLDLDTGRLSICRTVQLAGGRIVEGPCKTRTSRRCVDLDPTTVAVLTEWRDRQHATGRRCTPDTAVFTTVAGQPINPDLLSQTFERAVARANLRRIRFHDLRHTHASLLVQAGTPIKVVSERLGHANPGFTMATYQHVIPGMQAAAAQQFANLIHSTAPGATVQS